MAKQERTPAQKAVTERNTRAFQLGGLRAHAHFMTGWRRKVMLWLIDQEERQCK